VALLKNVFVKIILIVFFIVLSLVFLYEFVYIQSKPAIYYLEKIIEKTRNRDKTFRVYYYFNAIEFSNIGDIVFREIENEPNSLSNHYVLISKVGVFINKATKYFEKNSKQFFVIISNDLNIRELYKGYSFVKKNFKIQQIFATKKELIHYDYSLFMSEIVRLPIKNYSHFEFQEIVQKLQKSK
jgi:hypothetical protein